LTIEEIANPFFLSLQHRLLVSLELLHFIIKYVDKILSGKSDEKEVKIR
jgi:hypothetical protein